MKRFNPSQSQGWWWSKSQFGHKPSQNFSELICAVGYLTPLLLSQLLDLSDKIWAWINSHNKRSKRFELGNVFTELARNMSVTLFCSLNQCSSAYLKAQNQQKFSAKHRKILNSTKQGRIHFFRLTFIMSTWHWFRNIKCSCFTDLVLLKI